jgi:hypothetical protein
MPFMHCTDDNPDGPGPVEPSASEVSRAFLRRDVGAFVEAI